MSELGPAVDRFFTDILVMTDDLPLRTARLSLMAHLRNAVRRIGDVSEVVAVDKYSARPANAPEEPGLLGFSAASPRSTLAAMLWVQRRVEISATEGTGANKSSYIHQLIRGAAVDAFRTLFETND